MKRKTCHPKIGDGTFRVYCEPLNSRLFHIHRKLAITALMPTLYSHIFAVFFIICIIVIVKLDVSWQKVLPFKVGDFISLFNFLWHGQNEVGNIAILVLWTDREKLYWLALKIGLHIFIRHFRDTTSKRKVVPYSSKTHIVL